MEPNGRSWSRLGSRNGRPPRFAALRTAVGAASIAASLTIVLAACSSSSSPSGGAQPDTPSAEAHVTFLAASGADISQPANVTVRTLPGTKCSIEYINPAGRADQADGLGDRKADGNGTISWSWRVADGTPKGVGIVTVRCGRAALSIPIGIGEEIPFTPGASR
jgi:hypothetical protein